MTLAHVEVARNLKIAMDKPNLAQHIEQTLLSPACTQDEIVSMCERANAAGVLAVCVPPFFVPTAKKALEDSETKVVTVVGFPFGYSNINTKAEETKKAISEKVDEIDMVMNISAFKSGLISHVSDGIDSIKTLCGMSDKPLKVIIESGILSEEELLQAAAICMEKEVDFVKTSTGFNGKGASIKTVKMLRNVLPESIGIKASGGIKDLATAEKMLMAGATRIGTSSGFDILGL